jgi:hypothetical protein
MPYPPRRAAPGCSNRALPPRRAAPGCSWLLLAALTVPYPPGAWAETLYFTCPEVPYPPGGLLLAAPGCSWLLLAAPGCSWLLLAAPGGSKRLLAAPGGSWLLLAAPGCSWLLLAAPGCSWLLLAAPGGSKRLLAAPGGSWLLLAAPGCSCLLLAAHRKDAQCTTEKLRTILVSELLCPSNRYTHQPIYAYACFLEDATIECLVVINKRIHNLVSPKHRNCCIHSNLIFLFALDNAIYINGGVHTNGNC